MDIAPRLRAVRPLPAKWDGLPVEWRDLAVIGGSMDLHLPPHCDECGSERPPWRSGGRVYLGRTTSGRMMRPTVLHAERCQDCLHDVVYDERTGERWNLGPEDYGLDGSSEVVGSLW